MPVDFVFYLYYRYPMLHAMLHARRSTTTSTSQGAAYSVTQHALLCRVQSSGVKFTGVGFTDVMLAVPCSVASPSSSHIRHCWGDVLSLDDRVRKPLRVC